MIMSLMQKFSIKKINRIRKILLLYIDKDLKMNNKKRKLNKDSFSEKINQNNIMYQKAFSEPIIIKQSFKNISKNEEKDFIPIIQNQNNNTFYNIYPINCYSNRSNNISSSIKSFYSNNSQETVEFGSFTKREISNDIIFKLDKNKKDIKHINKLQKTYIIIKNNDFRQKKKLDSMNYLLNLTRNFKCKIKREKFFSCAKINKKKKKDDKETIMEVKNKQKGKN